MRDANATMQKEVERTPQWEFQRVEGPWFGMVFSKCDNLAVLVAIMSRSLDHSAEISSLNTANADSLPKACWDGS